MSTLHGKEEQHRNGNEESGKGGQEKEEQHDHTLTTAYLSDIDLKDDTALRVLVDRSIGEDIKDENVYTILDDALYKSELLLYDFGNNYKVEEWIKLLLKYSFFRRMTGIEVKHILTYAIYNIDSIELDIRNLPRDYDKILKALPKYSQELCRSMMDAVTYFELLILGMIYEVVIPTEINIKEYRALISASHYGHTNRYYIKRPPPITTAVSFGDHNFSIEYKKEVFTPNQKYHGSFVWNYYVWMGSAYDDENIIDSIDFSCYANINRFSIKWPGKSMRYGTEISSVILSGGEGGGGRGGSNSESSSKTVITQTTTRTIRKGNTHNNKFDLIFSNKALLHVINNEVFSIDYDSGKIDEKALCRVSNSTKIATLLEMTKCRWSTFASVADTLAEDIADSNIYGVLDNLTISTPSM